MVASLITLDGKWEELYIPSLISVCWKKKPENSGVLSFLYDTYTDEKYVRASEIMTKEQGEKWDGSTFTELTGRNYSGYATLLNRVQEKANNSQDIVEASDRRGILKVGSVLHSCHIITRIVNLTPFD